MAVMIRVLLLAILLGGASSALCQTPSGIPQSALKASSKWNIDYGSAQCAAGRRFGPSDSPVTLAIRPAPNGETYELRVMTQGRSAKYADQLQVDVEFGGSFGAAVLRYPAQDGRGVIHAFRIPRERMEQARSAKFMRIQRKGGVIAAVELSSLPAVLDELERCTADLMQHWNKDGENDGRIAKNSSGDIREIFRAEDFPISDALRMGQSATAQFLLLIDEGGKVAACEVLRPSGIPVFDAGACQVTRARAVFTAARDRNGKPVRSMVVTPPITWRWN
jgi:TonB family protein